MSTKIILLFSLALDDTSSEAKKGQGPTIINLIEDFYPRNAHSRAHVSRFANFYIFMFENSQTAAWLVLSACHSSSVQTACGYLPQLYPTLREHR